MELLTTILLQLLAVTLSGILSAMWRAPLPLLQIALGAALTLLIGERSPDLDPALFLLLFVAPLLYMDAFHFPQEEFFRLRRPIIAAAVGLVVFTVVGTGYFIHWLLPSIPLAICFAFAAVLSPTDAVAVAGSLGGVRPPDWFSHLLEGEALLNDASGLVCLRFALAAALSGQFFFGNAIGSFVLVAAGGILVGFAFVILVAPARGWMERTLGSQPAIMILIHLLMPFAVYLAAEHIHVSGILAAVTAGFTNRWYHQDKPAVALRLRADAVTDAVQFTFNGLVFVLLGLQLPDIARGLPAVARSAGLPSIWKIGILAAEIMLALMLLRFLWMLTASFLPGSIRKDKSALGTLHRTRLRTVFSVTLAGVRGAVTLAAILSFPFALPNGSPLPGRELAITLSAGIILLWLILASTSLPWLVKGITKVDQNDLQARERNAQNRMIQAAIQHLEALGSQTLAGLPEEAAAKIIARLTASYRRRISDSDSTPSDEVSASLLLTTEKDLRLEAIRAERKELRRLSSMREIDHHSFKRLLLSLDAAEAALTIN